MAVEAAVAGFLLALVLGLAFALARRSSWRIIAWPVTVFISFVRSTPLLVQLYFLYFVLPEYGIALSALTTGIFALGVHYACYTAEVYRAGLESIGKGQWDAAVSLNLSRWNAYRYVIIPQALPPIVAPLGNYLIAMFKETPLLSAITVMELMMTAKIIGSESFRYLEPITIIGVLFLAMSVISAMIIRAIEARIGKRGLQAYVIAR
ncbi:polar amino acid transport system permease protein [Rhodoligotrophos appendicifer]